MRTAIGTPIRAAKGISSTNISLSDCVLGGFFGVFVIEACSTPMPPPAYGLSLCRAARKPKDLYKSHVNSFLLLLRLFKWFL